MYLLLYKEKLKKKKKNLKNATFMIPLGYRELGTNTK